jgi:hypothetical protein
LCAAKDLFTAGRAEFLRSKCPEFKRGIVSVKYDEYHRNADDCLQMALTVTSNGYRVSWLKLAQAWLQMIPPDQLKSARETHQAIIRLRATHANDLKSSH